MTEQMIQSGKLKMLATKQEMEIQLKPEYLGKLAIRLTLENGAMTARFIVRKPSGRQDAGTKSAPVEADPGRTRYSF